MPQIALKNYDPSRDKRFSGTFKLPTIPRPNMKVCVLGNAVHCEEAERIGVEHKSVEDLKKFNKNKKIIKKFAKKCVGQSCRASFQDKRVCPRDDGDAWGREELGRKKSDAVVRGMGTWGRHTSRV